MAYLGSIKRGLYRLARGSGINQGLLASSWRRRRLLVLCYHGISLRDEHSWSPLYMSAALFRSRMEMIRSMGCTVLPLGRAVEMLYSGTLPPRSVVITFDDGFYDFYAKAWPILREFQFPATTYLTTYYSVYNVPVFDPALGYLLWKGRGRVLSYPDAEVNRITLDASTDQAVARKIKQAALERHLTGAEKNELLRDVASRLGIDFDELCAARLLHLMTPEEARQVAAEGCDLELHTHRHRVYRSRERMRREIKENGETIQKISGATPAHFCYPGGHWLPQFPEWFAEFGIQSATTCRQALAARTCSRFLIPRLLDGPNIPMDEFAAWLSGLADFVPRRTYPFAEGQLGEDDPPALAPRAVVRV